MRFIQGILLLTTLFAASFTMPSNGGTAPVGKNKCCLPASELPPSWPECRTKCQRARCPVGHQVGRVAGGQCATQKDKECNTSSGTIDVHKYKCSSVLQLCPDGKAGYVCKLVKESGLDTEEQATGCTIGSGAQSACTVDG